MPKPLPLILSARPATWRMDDAQVAGADPAFDAVREKVLGRDRHACRFCGFRALRWQEIFHRNDDHADLSEGNLATACLHCHMCHHLGRVDEMGEGVLIWAPDLDQDALHHLVRSIHVTLHAHGVSPTMKDRPQSPTPLLEAAMTIYSGLLQRSALSTRFLRTHRPMDLGSALIDLAPSDYAERAKLLGGIRLLPTGRRIVNGKDVYPQILDSWMTEGGPYAKLPIDRWDALFERARQRAGHLVLGAPEAADA